MHIPADIGELEASTLLRRQFTPEVVREALQQRDLRRRAQGRLHHAEKLFFTSRGLEQATRGRVADARAERIARLMPTALVLDATAGIGSDSLALASKNLRLLSADLDPDHAKCLAKNLARCGFRAHVVIADAARLPAKPDVLVCDPDRRVGNRRSLDPERWSPKLSTCLDLASQVRGACFKLAPALDVEQVGSLPFRQPHSWQWTSADGDLVEVALWTGELAAPSGEREIQIIAGESEPVHYRGVPEPEFHLSVEEALSMGWISEPDPALIRSGLLAKFARERDLHPIGPSIAYLASKNRPDPSPFLKSWRVIASESADRRRVRALLREHDIGELVIKKRGHPRTAAELAREFRGKGTQLGTLIVTRLERGHRAFLVTPLESEALS